MFEEEQLFKRAGDLAPYFEERFSLRGYRVIDVRNMGMVAGIELDRFRATARAFEGRERVRPKGVPSIMTGARELDSPFFQRVEVRPSLETEEQALSIFDDLRVGAKIDDRPERLSTLVALAELHQAVVAPFGRELFLHRILPQLLVERRPVQGVRRLVLVEA